MRFHPKFRIFLLMLAFGLASARFFSYVYESLTEVQVDLPQVSSESPIVVIPNKVPFDSTIAVQKLLSRNRDLSLYEIGTDFSSCFRNASKTSICERIKIEARAFVFNHWKEKKRAYIIYKIEGMDSSNTAHILVEPDNNNKWKVIFVWEGNRDSSLEIIESNVAKYKCSNKNQPQNCLLELSYLSFLDKNGKEVESF